MPYAVVFTKSKHKISGVQVQQWQTMQHCRGVRNILCTDDAT